jgi:hypothetical protein
MNFDREELIKLKRICPFEANNEVRVRSPTVREGHTRECS